MYLHDTLTRKTYRAVSGKKLRRFSNHTGVSQFITKWMCWLHFVWKQPCFLPAKSRSSDQKSYETVRRGKKFQRGLGKKRMRKITATNVRATAMRAIHNQHDDLFMWVSKRVDSFFNCCRLDSVFDVALFRVWNENEFIFIVFRLELQSVNQAYNYSRWCRLW